MYNIESLTGRDVILQLRLLKGKNDFKKCPF